jgi:hypothetical protein
MAFQTPIMIGKALERIHRHDYVLPAIQREFVWQTEQIARLFDSLLQGYPIGSFLFWKVDKTRSRDYVFYDFMRDYHQRTAKHLERLDLGEGRDITAILDGQQRLTALNIGLRGSHAEKLPRKWYDNASAYPVRSLYLNLAEAAPENELGMLFDFRFLTKDRAGALSGTEGQHWFLVSRILTMESGPGLFDYVQDAGLGASKFAFRTLSRLHDVVHRDAIVNFFEEESQDLDKVLNIFIRVNSGGTTLSYSDLLLSIATAQWKDVEAREVIHGLVDALNETGQGFSFSKDLVLKAGLVLVDTPSIAFRVTNFNAANMAALETSWESIAHALRLAVRLISDFGFSERTLTAYSVVIPVAYYLHQRGATESYLTIGSEHDDRERVRSWAVRSLLKPGVWGSGLDQLLLSLRNTIREHGAMAFPSAELESTMSRLGKSLRFDDDEVQDLLSLSYNDKRVFPLLSLLYPGMNFKNEFHIDHVFPKSLLSRRHLTSAGFPEANIEPHVVRADQLPNLQLLDGPVNVAKQDKLPAKWMNGYLPDLQARQAYQTRHELWDLPENIDGFMRFYSARQAKIGDRLRAVLGVQPG